MREVLPLLDAADEEAARLSLQAMVQLAFTNTDECLEVPRRGAKRVRP